MNDHALPTPRPGSWLSRLIGRGSGIIMTNQSFGDFVRCSDLAIGRKAEERCRLDPAVSDASDLAWISCVSDEMLTTVMPPASVSRV
jgi:hypothetical protein